MKKILVLSFALLFATAALAQDVYFYYGWPGTGVGDPGNEIYIGVNKNVEIPLFLKCDEPDMVGASFNSPIGINNEFADDIVEGSCYIVPTSSIHTWDVLEFTNTQEDALEVQTYYGTASTWDTYTLHGIKDIQSPYDNPPFTSQVPEAVAVFVIHTVDNPALLNTTTCLLQNAANDPFEGWPNMSDTTGNVNYNVIWDAACYYFSPNQGVEIRPLFNADDYCGYTDFQLFYDVFEPDGDAVETSVTAGTVSLLGSDPEGDGIVYHYVIDFVADDFCGECFNGDLAITAVDGSFASPINDPVTVDGLGTVTMIGQMTASMNDSLYIWPGLEDWMDVSLDVCGDCFCLGSFVFTIQWDASVLSVTDVMQGAALAGGDYWNVNMGVAGNGTLRVTFINNLNDQNPNDDICGLFEDPIFQLKFLLDPAYNYPENFCIPICFMDEGYTFNNVADADGYTVWMPDGCDDPPDSAEYTTFDLALECGNIKVGNIHNTILGDLNNNRHPFDAGDVVLLANHLIDPDAYPFTLRQMFASDVNQDGYQASIADLIYMINTIDGYDMAKLAPLDVAATVTMPAEASGNVDVRIESEASVGGAYVEIAHTGVELGVPTADGMNVQYSDNGEVMKVLVYNNDPMHNSVDGFVLPVLSEGAVSINNVEISNAQGALLDARSEVAAAIPEIFSVNQNYPNPFNAKTSISFGLPTPSDVNINIYNVAGQLVQSMNYQNMTAGMHSVVWDASDVASGVYFYKVSADNHTETLKMTLLK